MRVSLSCLGEAVTFSCCCFGGIKDKDAQYFWSISIGYMGDNLKPFFFLHNSSAGSLKISNKNHENFNEIL